MPFPEGTAGSRHLPEAGRAARHLGSGAAAAERGSLLPAWRSVLHSRAWPTSLPPSPLSGQLAEPRVQPLPVGHLTALVPRGAVSQPVDRGPSTHGSLTSGQDAVAEAGCRRRGKRHCGPARGSPASGMVGWEARVGSAGPAVSPRQGRRRAEDGWGAGVDGRGLAAVPVPPSLSVPATLPWPSPGGFTLAAAPAVNVLAPLPAPPAVGALGCGAAASGSPREPCGSTPARVT